MREEIVEGGSTVRVDQYVLAGTCYKSERLIGLIVFGLPGSHCFYDYGFTQREEQLQRSGKRSKRRIENRCHISCGPGPLQSSLSWAS